MAGDVKNYPGGKPVVILGTDGTDLYGITVDTSGHVQVDVLSNALPSGAATETTLASVLAKLDVALSTRALEAGGNLAAILAKLDVALSTRALESGGNLAAILAKLDVALSTRALEAGGNLASALTALQLIDDFALGTNKIFGYYDRYAEAVENLNPGAGGVALAFTAVSAGEIWVIQGITALDNTSNPTAIELGILAPGISLSVYRVASPGVGVPACWGGQLVLKAGDYVRIWFSGVVAGDDIYAKAWGYKMKIA